MRAINAIIALSLQKSKQALKGTGAKRDVCSGSSVSSGAKFSVVPTQSAPMLHLTAYTSFWRVFYSLAYTSLRGRIRRKPLVLTSE